MRVAELPRVVQALRPPIQRFVRESRARIALVVTGSGQVLAQHGFARSYEVMNVASLAAAAHAAANALGRVTGAGAWRHIHQAGARQDMFLATLRTPVENLIFVVIFDAESSLGLVQLFFGRLSEQVAVLPEFQLPVQSTTTQASFERDLEEGLQRVFLPDAQSR
jgi:predicted regulator of Ras-like GTPase activity (Roadblock/LC7/MglB family)